MHSNRSNPSQFRVSHLSRRGGGDAVCLAGCLLGVVSGVGARVLPTIPSLLLHAMCHPRRHDWGLPQFFQRLSFFSWFVATTLGAVVAVGVGGASVHFIPHLWYPP
jgi:hypothetical protein